MGATTAFGFRKAKISFVVPSLTLHGCPSRPNPGEECERLAFVEGVHRGREPSGRLLILGKACEQNDVLTLDAEPTPQCGRGDVAHKPGPLTQINARARSSAMVLKGGRIEHPR